MKKTLYWRIRNTVSKVNTNILTLGALVPVAAAIDVGKEIVDGIRGWGIDKNGMIIDKGGLIKEVKES